MPKREPKPKWTPEELREIAKGDRGGGRYALDAHPEAAALLADVLSAAGPDAYICWGSVAKFIRQQFPSAPTDRMTYRRYAEQRLGRG